MDDATCTPLSPDLEAAASHVMHPLTQRESFAAHIRTEADTAANGRYRSTVQVAVPGMVPGTCITIRNTTAVVPVAKSRNTRTVHIRARWHAAMVQEAPCM
jgi:hypothetical protein